MDTLSTVIEFVSSNEGSGGTGDISTSSSNTTATGDSLFVVCIVVVALLLIAIRLFVYIKFQRKTSQSLTGKCIRSITSRYDEKCKFKKIFPVSMLVIPICAFVIVGCFVITGFDKVFAYEKATITNANIASVSEKVTATVDGTGNVKFSKGLITNNNDVLAIGVRQVKSESVVDLSDSILKINCGDKELYNKTIDSIQLNDNYVTVPVGDAADLDYTITMPAI